MKNTMKKILCIALVLMMAIPMLAINIGATTYPTYAAAADGDLLYTANFNGDSRWAPSTESAIANAGWNWTNSTNMTATVDAQDSGKATITLGVQDNAAWGGDITDLPLGAGYNYTVKYTVSCADGSKPIGLLIDGHYGAYAYSVKGRLQRNGSALSGHKYIEYTANNVDQEYAIVVNGDTSGFAFYMKDSTGAWVEIDSGNPTDGDGGVFSRDCLGLYFYAYHKTEVTVSNVDVYKGLADKNLINSTPTVPETPADPDPETPADPETPTEPEKNLDSSLYDAANEGDVVYTANFAGDTKFFPTNEKAAAQAGWNWPCDNIKAEVDAADTGKVTITVSEKKNSAWGDDIVGLPLGAGYNYTVKFTVYREANTPIGLLIDGTHGCYVYTNKGRLQRNGNALDGHTYASFADFTDITIPDLSADTYDPSTQEYALEVNGDDVTVTLYVKDSQGQWVKIDTGTPRETPAAFLRDYLGLYFYSYFETVVTASNVQVYKGISVLSAEGKIDPVLPDDGSTDGSGSLEEGTTPPAKDTSNNKPPVLVEDKKDETEAVEETAAAEEKKGCGSSIGFGGAALIVASAIGMTKISFRRRDDE